jgi:putative FmdB family regulatory protein
MPIYEYFCPQCKNEFELRFSFVQTDCTTLCPKCYSVAQKLISSFACKTGGNIQTAEKPFRKEAGKPKKTGAKTRTKRSSRKTNT